MMKLINAALIFFLFACAHPPARLSTLEESDQLTVDGPLSYTLDYTPCQAVPCLKITVEFEGNSTGKTRLILPNSNSGQKELYRAIHQLEPLASGVTVSATQDPHLFDLRFQPHQHIALQYQVIQDFQDPVESQDQYYRAMITEDHFFTFGEQIFAKPVIQREAPREINLTLKNQRIPYADSFGVGSQVRHLHLSLQDFLHGTFLGGAFHFSQIAVSRKPIHIAILGTFGFKQTEFNRLLKSIFTIERDFWRDHDFPYFLVTAIPAREHGRGGTGRTNSFSLFMNSKSKIDRELVYLLAHELFHTWNGRRIERVEPEELQYWFSEGFTDYYMSTLAFRAGLIDFKEYLREYNEVIRRYTLSQARNEPVDRVLKDFWNDSEVEKLPYQQGTLLAHRWNLQILKQTHGLHHLDDFMLDFLAEAKNQGTKVSAENVDRIFRKYLPDGIRADHEAFVVKGETIPVNADELGECARLESKPIPIFDLGLDEPATKREHVIRGVNPNGPAFLAGLRDGMPIRGWDHDRSRFKANYTVLVDGVEKKFTYDAQKWSIPVPQFVLDEVKYKRHPKRCEAVVRGALH